MLKNLKHWPWVLAFVETAGKLPKPNDGIGLWLLVHYVQWTVFCILFVHTNTVIIDLSGRAT
mgnify:CR=1 FL=1